MRALVTGAAGFIGSHVVKALLNDGRFDVRAFHLPSDRLDNLAGLDIEFFEGDVTNRDSVRAAVSGCEVVFHLAAIYSLWTRDLSVMFRVNVGGTKNVLEACRDAGVRRVVYTSSIARFGGQGINQDATEESAFRLGSTGDRYAISKRDSHEVALQAVSAGQDVVIVAPTGPIGPGDIGPTPTGKLLLTAVNYPVAFAPRSVSCFADVRDMAKAHIQAFDRGKTGESYLLGTENIEMPDLVRRVLAHCRLSRPMVIPPFALCEAAADVALLAADLITERPPLFTPAAIEIAKLGLRARCDKAVRELGAEQNPVDFAIRDALRWFAEKGYIHNKRVRARLLA